ncbi:MAG: hypothetical protein KDA58_09555 [Planctomycetaceae bacterium]|nr:hypothetical protein [Planctomycetaceae bacterium]
MQRTSLPTLAGVLLAALVGASGCQSMSTISRGQSPADPAIQAAGFHHAPCSDVTHYGEVQNTGPGCGPQGCPSGYCPQGGYCPEAGYGYGGGMCPHGPGCRSCGCGNHLDWYPRHHMSYSYSAPNDLKYPTPNSPSGVIQYPYYTLKGPSDFFRQ